MGSGDRVGSGDGVGEGVGEGAGEIVGSGVGVADGVGVGVTGGFTTIIYSMRLSVLVTEKLRMVKLTLYVPGVSYICAGFRKAVSLVLYHVPSPNDQFQSDGKPPVEISEKLTVRGAVPSLTEAEKFTTKGVKAAAARARKALQEMSKCIKERRKEITAEKEAMTAAK